MLRSSIALILFCGVVIKSDSNAEHNVYTNAVRSPGSKAKKIQIVYIKVPLSKVLESQNPSEGYNTGDRGYADGGGGQQQNYDNNAGGIPGEGRLPNYSNNNIGNSYPNYGDNNFAANQNIYDSVKPNGQEDYGQSDGYNQQQQQQQQQQEESNIGSYGNGQQKQQTINYQNDANLGAAYGAAVGNALPPNTHFDDSPNYGQENQNNGYQQTNQINYEQNNAFPPNPSFNRPLNDGYNEGYGGDNYDKRKIRKGNQPFSKMMANFRPQIPIMSTLPFAMKGFNPSLGMSFPSFGGQPFAGMAAMPISSISGLSGITGMPGITGSMKGFGGIKSKLSMLLGNKFGGAGGLLGGMMGWD